jgi:hypothetical protein
MRRFRLERNGLPPIKSGADDEARHWNQESCDGVTCWFAANRHGAESTANAHSSFAETLWPQKSCDSATEWFARNVPNRQEGAAICGCAQQILQQPDVSERFLNALIKRVCVRRLGAKTAKSAQHWLYG